MTIAPVSSVDTRPALAGIKTALDAISDGFVTYEGVSQATELPLDGFGHAAPYRDLQPGNTVPAAKGRTVGGGEQAQPHIFSFQVNHVAKTRTAARDLAIESDLMLIGLVPSADASKIKGYYFQSYDKRDDSGDTIEWIVSRFYETTLGMVPDFTLQ